MNAGNVDKACKSNGLYISHKEILMQVLSIVPNLKIQILFFSFTRFGRKLYQVRIFPCEV